MHWTFHSLIHPHFFCWYTHITTRSSKPSVEPRILPFIHTSIQTYTHSHPTVHSPIVPHTHIYLLVRPLIQLLIDASPIYSHIHQSIHTRHGVRKHRDKKRARYRTRFSADDVLQSCRERYVLGKRVCCSDTEPFW
jgi:hypothetical protein